MSTSATPAIRPPTRRTPLLFDEFPALAQRVPWMPLAHTPTPVARLTALAPYLGRDDLWVKRDDLISPLYGGNKVRRFEFLLADAIARGATRLVTAGGLASTQVMATALFGRALGLGVRAVLFDQPVTHFARRAILADLAAGAELIYGGGYLRTTTRTLGAMRRDAGNHLVLPGATGPRANLGYIDAMLELAAQVAAGEMPRPDAIVVATGSAGTLVGLALGAAYLGWPTEVIGVRITTALACNAFTVRVIASLTARSLGSYAPGFARRIERGLRFSIDGSALGRGYGEPTPAAIEGAKWVRAVAGVEGEVTYSGKALAALRTLARSERYARKNLLLWQTLSGVEPPMPDDGLASVPPSLRWVFEGETVA